MWLFHAMGRIQGCSHSSSHHFPWWTLLHLYWFLVFCQWPSFWLCHLENYRLADSKHLVKAMNCGNELSGSTPVETHGEGLFSHGIDWDETIDWSCTTQIASTAAWTHRYQTWQHSHQDRLGTKWKILCLIQGWSCHYWSRKNRLCGGGRRETTPAPKERTS